MPPMNARTASKLTGKDRSTILRAVENGRLSATKNERGQWLIDPAELERVYGSLRVPDAPSEPSNHDAYALQVASLTREVELLRETVAHDRRTARETLEHERRQWDEERTFLRGMLEKQAEQVRLLTDQREQKRRSPALFRWFRRT
jgi:hypothetical protein